MTRALVAFALLLLSSAATATEYWQDSVNTNGNVSVVSPSGGSCFLYQTAPFNIQCYTTIPASIIDTVPTGVLEGVGGAITGYAATPQFVQFGAASGGGIAQSTNLQWDGTYFKVGSHVTSPQAGIRSIESTSAATQLDDYPTSGTNVSNFVRVTPKGSGVAGFVVDNTDVWAANPTETLTVGGLGTTGFVIATNFILGGSNRPILLGTDDPTGPLQFDLNTNGTSSFGIGDVLLTLSGAQAITKTGGALSIGTGAATALNLKTNATTRIAISSTGVITVPAFTGGGNQCAYFDNAGTLSVTGSACGTGTGAGGITQLTGDVTAGPGSGSQAATLVNLPNDVSQAGDLLATAIAAPATPSAGKARVYVNATSKNLEIKNDAGTVNHGAQTIASTTGVALTGLSDAGAWTTQNFQAPLTACTDYVSLSCVTGATDLGGSNATPTVTGIESAATMRGSVIATEIATPSAPAAGKLTCWAGNVSDNWMCKANSGTITHGTQDFSCGANTWASSETTNGTVTCTQPAFSSLSGSIACSQLPAFTGDTTKVSGSCATVTGALHDGAAVQHPTAGTWSNSSLLQTDSFGQIGTGSASCSQVSGTKTLYDGGSCAGTAWTTSGTWTNGQALITSGGTVTTTNQCNVNATCAASGDLGGTYQGPNVVAMHDGGSVRHPTSGTWSTSSLLATDSSGNIVTQATPTKLTYSLQLILGSNTPNTWLLEGGPGLWSSGAFIEYPNDFKATRIQVIWDLTSNIVLTGALSVFATRNGSGIGGTGFSITSATSTGVHVGTNLPTSSTSSSDTYGLAFTTDNLYSAASPSAVFVTVEVLLLP